MDENVFPVDNLFKIKLDEKEWDFFKILNDKLLDWSKINYDYTIKSKELCVEFIKKSIDKKFKVESIISETYIPEGSIYLVEFNFGKSVYCTISIDERQGYPNLIPGDIIDSKCDVNILTEEI